MGAGLNIPWGSNMNAVVASTVRFLLTVEFVGCTWVVVFLTCSWLLVEFHSNLSFVTTSSLSSHNVYCVFVFWTYGRLGINVDWFHQILILGIQYFLVKMLSEVVTQHDEVRVLMRQTILLNHTMHSLLRKYAVVMIFLWENIIELWMDAAGCSFLLFHHILHFLYIRNLVYQILPASRANMLP